MHLLGASSDFPFELILLLVAAIIGGLNKLLEASRKMRKKSLEDHPDEDKHTGIELEEAKPRRPRPGEIHPKPEQPKAETELPLPDFRVPIPMPSKLAPKPVARRVEVPRRPRPPKPRLQLGVKPTARPMVRPIPTGKPKMPLQRPVRTRPAMKLNLHDRKRVREAIVLREVLGPPLALRSIRRW